jgi:hypothetical protein
MKKLAAILFSIFYLTVTIGFAINVHYCHGEIRSVEVFADEGSCCCGDGAITSACCHVDSQFVKFENEQASISNFKLNIQVPVFNLPVTYDHPVEPVYSIDFSTFHTEADLLPPELPAWLRYCSLVYYG